jgi:amidohydrolase
VDPIQFIEAQRNTIFKIYHELHQLAEPSWKEEKTSRYLQDKLIAAGFTVHTFSGHFGFVADLPGETPEVIALRADMDALVQEVNGVVQPNHSCGHDAHSTMVLMTALTLCETKIKFKHSVRFIFQPAEEVAGGALKMIEDGALKNVKFLGGVHLRPSFEVEYGKAAPVILHGSTTTLKGVIKGIPAHAARPEEGNNPIEAASLLIQAMKQIKLGGVGRYSIKMTELHSGEASNAIPENARFTFDLRSETNEGMELLISKAKHIVEKIAELTETKIDTVLEEYSPAAVNNSDAIKVASTAINSILGNQNLESACVSPGAEDFHFYTLKNQDIFATMIGLGCDLTPGLHHPNMKFNHEALVYGTKVLTKLLLEADQNQWV